MIESVDKADKMPAQMRRPLQIADSNAVEFAQVLTPISENFGHSQESSHAFYYSQSIKISTSQAHKDPFGTCAR